MPHFTAIERNVCLLFFLPTLTYLLSRLCSCCLQRLSHTVIRLYLMLSPIKHLFCFIHHCLLFCGSRLCVSQILTQLCLTVLPLLSLGNQCSSLRIKAAQGLLRALQRLLLRINGSLGLCSLRLELLDMTIGVFESTRSDFKSLTHCIELSLPSDNALFRVGFASRAHPMFRNP